MVKESMIKLEMLKLFRSEQIEEARSEEGVAY